MTTKGLLLAGGITFVLAMVLGMSHPETKPLDGPFESAELVITRYLVSGGSLNALQQQMARKGPRGKWGMARPNWTWDVDCNVRLQVRVTMPKLSGRWRLRSQDLVVWDQMMEALWAHEMAHVEIARQAALEVKRSGCQRDAAAQILAKHNDEQSAFDRRTDNGAREGVTLQP